MPGKGDEGFLFRIVQFPYGPLPAAYPVGAVGNALFQQSVVDALEVFPAGKRNKEVPAGESHEPLNSALFVSPPGRAEAALKGVPGAKADKAFLFLSRFSEKDFFHRCRQVVKDHYGKDSSVIEEPPAQSVEKRLLPFTGVEADKGVSRVLRSHAEDFHPHGLLTKKDRGTSPVHLRFSSRRGFQRHKGFAAFQTEAPLD